jgi:hypothetical protein
LPRQSVRPSYLVRLVSPPSWLFVAISSIHIAKQFHPCCADILSILSLTVRRLRTASREVGRVVSVCTPVQDAPYFRNSSHVKTESPLLSNVFGWSPTATIRRTSGWGGRNPSPRPPGPQLGRFAQHSPPESNGQQEGTFLVCRKREQECYTLMKATGRSNIARVFRRIRIEHSVSPPLSQSDSEGSPQAQKSDYFGPENTVSPQQKQEVNALRCVRIHAEHIRFHTLSVRPSTLYFPRWSWLRPTLRKTGRSPNRLGV